MFLSQKAAGTKNACMRLPGFQLEFCRAGRVNVRLPEGASHTACARQSLGTHSKPDIFTHQTCSACSDQLSNTFPISCFYTPSNFSAWALQEYLGFPADSSLEKTQHSSSPWTARLPEIPDKQWISPDKKQQPEESSRQDQSACM